VRVSESHQTFLHTYHIPMRFAPYKPYRMKQEWDGIRMTYKIPYYTLWY